MSANRKLLTEIDRTLKKVEEGVEIFDEIWDKVYSATQQNQKEKFEVDLKKEIKKLQRHRDQIKTWVASSDIKDKRALTEARKLIETKMEQFKVCEKETKTKTYSKEGLARETKIDPHEAAKHSTREWLSEKVDALMLQIDMHEADMEKLTSGKGSKKNKHEIDALEGSIKRHRWHIAKLEQITRLLDNDALQHEQINEIKEDVEYYIDANQEPDFMDAYDETMDIFESLDLGELPQEDDPSIVVKEKAVDDVDDGKKKKKKDKKKDDGDDDDDDKKDDKKKEKKSKKDKSGEKEDKEKDKKKKGDKKTETKTAAVPLTIGRATVAKAAPAAAPAVPAAGVPKKTAPTPGVPTPVNVVPGPPAAESLANIILKQQQAAAVQQKPPPVAGGTPGEMAARLREVAAQPTAAQRLQQKPVVAVPPQQQPRPAFATVPAPPSPQQQQQPYQQPQPQQPRQVAPPPVAQPPPQQPQPFPPTAGGPPPPPGTQQQPQASPSRVPGSPSPLRPTPQTPLAASPGGQPKSPVMGPLTPPPQSAPAPMVAPGMPHIENKKRPRRPISTTPFGPGANLEPLLDVAVSDHADDTYARLRDAKLRQADHKIVPADDTDRDLALGELAASIRTAPRRPDAERPRQYVPRNPYNTPAAFPASPAPVFDDPRVFDKLTTDTLFFIFYYQQGTYQQYLAARELKKQSWRYHKKYMTWFQRHVEPQVTTDEFEQGTYVYFDYETGWCQRIKSDFTFEYNFLEDELVA